MLRLAPRQGDRRVRQQGQPAANQTLGPKKRNGQCKEKFTCHSGDLNSFYHQLSNLLPRSVRSLIHLISWTYLDYDPTSVVFMTLLIWKNCESYNPVDVIFFLILKFEIMAQIITEKILHEIIALGQVS